MQILLYACVSATLTSSVSLARPPPRQPLACPWSQQNTFIALQQASSECINVGFLFVLVYESQSWKKANIHEQIPYMLRRFDSQIGQFQSRFNTQWPGINQNRICQIWKQSVRLFAVYHRRRPCRSSLLTDARIHPPTHPPGRPPTHSLLITTRR